MIRKRLNQKGFTMIEVMVVVIIVGILAAIAIPLYGKYVQNARTTEATGRMGEILTSGKAFALENDAWPQNSDDGNGLIDLTASDNFTYSITTGGGTPTGAFQVTATGVAGSKMEGATVVLDVANINSTGNFTVSLP